MDIHKPGATLKNGVFHKHMVCSLPENEEQLSQGLWSLHHPAPGGQPGHPPPPRPAHHAAQPLADTSLKDCGSNRLAARILKQVLKRFKFCFQMASGMRAQIPPQIVSSVQSKGNLIVLASVNRKRKPHILSSAFVPMLSPLPCSQV